jgi:hypothetical protein
MGSPPEMRHARILKAPSTLPTRFMVFSLLFVGANASSWVRVQQEHHLSA